jgi:glycosyltransferase involved in cell wall biosynthesis
VRVLAACHRYHPVPGGSERIAQLLAEGAARHGHEATMVTQAEPGLPDRETLNGVEVLRLQVRPIGGVRFPVGYLRTLRSHPAEVFHLHGNRIWCADFYLPVARLFPWRQLGTGHGFYQYAVGRTAVDRLYFERYFPRVLSGLDVYVCDTEFERHQLLGWGFPEKQLRRIPLGADAAEFARPGAPPEGLRDRWQLKAPLVAVYVGGFFANKRVDRLIDAVAAAPGPWALVAIGRDVPGSPYDRASCVRRASEQGVEFVAPGILPRDATVAAILAADAIVSGSEYEGFGVSLAEALAAGKPFVAFPAGAAPEMAATGGGIIAPTIREFSAALGRLADTGERAAISARARAAAPQWSEQAMVERYLSLYDELAALGRR